MIGVLKAKAAEAVAAVLGGNCTRSSRTSMSRRSKAYSGELVLARAAARSKVVALV